MHDLQIIQALIRRDEQTTRRFFFGDCRPLFLSVIRKVYGNGVDYDEFVNEFYLHLMENRAARLRQFEGRSSIYQWMKIVAIRYFLARKKREEKISASCPDEEVLERRGREEAVDSGMRVAAKMDVKTLLDQMGNERQVYVIKRLILDDAEPEKVAQELDVTVDNLYNIKKRALAALTKIALKS